MYLHLQPIMSELGSQYVNYLLLERFKVAGKIQFEREICVVCMCLRGSWFNFKFNYGINEFGG